MRRIACSLVLLAGCGRLGFDAGEGSLAGGDAAAEDGAEDGAIDAPVPPNRAFLTSTRHAATFGDVAFADGECQRLADAAGLIGTFSALLGDSTRDPDAGLATSRGWVDVTGAPVVDLPGQWLDGTMAHPLRRDETGATVTIAQAWLGANGRTCTGWTDASGAMTGSIASTGNTFTRFAVQTCASLDRFVCIERGRQVTLAPQVSAGRTAFVTATVVFVPGGGLAAADALCASEASTAGLPGNYRALLSAAGAAALSRFDLGGAPWVRVDGVALAPTAAALATVDYLDTFLLTSTGQPVPVSPASWAWTGTGGQTCADWTSTIGDGMVGDPSSAWRASWFTRQPYPCTGQRRLICLQT